LRNALVIIVEATDLLFFSLFFWAIDVKLLAARQPLLLLYFLLSLSFLFSQERHRRALVSDYGITSASGELLAAWRKNARVFCFFGGFLAALLQQSVEAPGFRRIWLVYFFRHLRKKASDHCGLCFVAMWVVPAAVSLWLVVLRTVFSTGAWSNLGTRPI
jgi:hypothetical protein